MTAVAPGTAALPDGGRVDFARMRGERRRRLLDAMAAEGLDAVILGRPANINYVTGARQLWTSGGRPWGPACVVVAASGRVHLLSTWDEGVPPEVAHEDLFGLTWNPANLVGSLKRIPGVSDATKVGTDGLGPGTAQLLSALAPAATLVDAGSALADARAVKTADEIGCLVTALAAAESALMAMVADLRPGVTERQLLGRCAEHLAGLGLPVLATQAVAFATPRRGPVRRRRIAPDGGAVGPGELVVLQPAAMYAGYEGAVGRTWATGEVNPAQRALAERAREALDALVGACRPGASGAELVRAWEQTGEELPPDPLAHGLGLGAEEPLIGAGVGADSVLRAGSVLSVQAWVCQEGAGGFLEQETVLVGEDGAVRLSRFGRGPAAGSDDGA